jgi:ATP-dependent Zn protease
MPRSTAELLAFGTATAGACDDLIQATKLARAMVCDWGMSERLGELAWQGQSAAHRSAVDAVADALLEHETLTGSDIATILATVTSTRPRQLAA